MNWNEIAMLIMAFIGTIVSIWRLVLAIQARPKISPIMTSEAMTETLREMTLFRHFKKEWKSLIFVWVLTIGSIIWALNVPMSFGTLFTLVWGLGLIFFSVIMFLLSYSISRDKTRLEQFGAVIQMLTDASKQSIVEIKTVNEAIVKLPKKFKSVRMLKNPPNHGNDL